MIQLILESTDCIKNLKKIIGKLVFSTFLITLERFSLGVNSNTLVK